MRVILRLFSRIGGIYREKKALKTTLYSYAKFMNPGIYILNNSYALKIRGVCFKHFLDSKALSFSKCGRDAALWVMWLLNLLIPPIFARVRPERFGKAKGELIFVSRSGHIKILNGLDRQVATIIKETGCLQDIYSKYMAIKNRYLVPKMTISNAQANILVEDLIVGDIFSRCVKEDRFELYKKIFFRREVCTGSNDLSYSCFRIDDLIVTLEKVNTIGVANNLIELAKAKYSSLGFLISSLPWVVSHGDLSVNNIVVADKMPFLIDFETVCYRPFFYDMCGLAYDEALRGNYDILISFVNGESDNCLRQYIATCDFEVNRGVRLNMLLAYLLMKVARDPVGRSADEMLSKNYYTLDPLNSLESLV